MASKRVDIDNWVQNLQSKEYGQAHLFKELPGSDGEQKAGIEKLVAQVQQLDDSYPGGLLNYLNRARVLLKDSKEGTNPFEGCLPSVPIMRTLNAGTAEFARMELKGLQELDKVCFVLVAGGLGERLGYPDIKIALPFETTTNAPYIKHYIDTILAIERFAESETGIRPKLPLAIMTSGDTHEKTIALLRGNQLFGLPEDQLTIMKQDKVAALLDNDARMATKAGDAYTIETKPHGHGDVHTLLKHHGLPSKWLKEGKKWVIFFQDTNGLVFHALPVALGVSLEEGLTMNSLTVPRPPGDSTGAICALQKDDGTCLTMNVEYNLLGPLLRSTGDGAGDVADPETGHSKYPGNINVLLFHLPKYSETLEASGGTVPEFVNPKYKDASKELFKSPTRLECMMQEFPRLFSAQDKVGCTQLERWLCFSTVKNNTIDAAAKAAASMPPECAFSGESDAYFSNAELLTLAAKAKKCSVVIPQPVPATYLGVQYKMGPRIVLHPSFGICLEQIKKRILGGPIKISARSTLILEGDVRINGLEVDGALFLKANPGKTLRVTNLTVSNAGWEVVELDENTNAPLPIKIRGYTLEEKAQAALLAE